MQPKTRKFFTIMKMNQCQVEHVQSGTIPILYAKSSIASSFLDNKSRVIFETSDGSFVKIQQCIALM